MIDIGYDKERELFFISKDGCVCYAESIERCKEELLGHIEAMIDRRIYIRLEDFIEKSERKDFV